MTINIILGLVFLLLIGLGITIYIATVITSNMVAIKRREILFKNYNNILFIFDKARETAYQKVFRENVLAYATSGYKVDDDKIGGMQNEYVSVVLTYCGPSIKEDLILIHGDFDSIVAYLVSDLMVRIENDESALINIKQQGTPPIGMDNGKQ